MTCCGLVVPLLLTRTDELSPRPSITAYDVASKSASSRCGGDALALHEGVSPGTAPCNLIVTRLGRDLDLFAIRVEGSRR